RLLDQGANREQILGAARELGQLAGADSTAWVYFAGHGAASPEDGEAMLVGVDAWGGAIDSRSVRLAELRGEMARGGARFVVLADAGFAGLGRDGTELLSGARIAVPVSVLDRSDDVIWIASEAERAPATLAPVEHGAFTYLAVGAMRGWADGFVDGAPDGIVTGAEAQAYVANAVRELGLAQRPELWSGEGELTRGAEEGPLLSGGEADWVASYEIRAEERRVAGVKLQVESLEVHAQRVAERTAAFQTQARREWLGIKSSLLPDTTGLFLASRDFYKTWSDFVVTIDGVEVPVPVPEAELALEISLGARLEREDWTSPTTGYRMAHVPAGTYIVGRPGREREVDLDHGFWIGETEVTVKMWSEAFEFAEKDAAVEVRCAESDDRHCLSNHYMERQRDGYGCVYNKDPDGLNFAPTKCLRCPVDGVSADNIMNFLAKMTRLDGIDGRYRLPTPDEWEIAARAGKEPVAGQGDGPRSVGGRANAWGLMGMPGNVPELTEEPG
ncbi:MAG: SUMF1/EgtB/PvdO family nonheme iron enzyme, partial [Proteobacteria bacterium]|nr:SUMF1/EgtB/PvdO family nonheme iron enzyme [Pseudomonadota bacterium]